MNDRKAREQIRIASAMLLAVGGLNLLTLYLFDLPAPLLSLIIIVGGLYKIYKTGVE